jgi:sugar phosphate isomerase/epimerase
MIDDGFKEVFDRWVPILKEFREYGVKFGHEAHPAEIAFDYYTSARLLETFKDWPEFGLNFDPSHLIWQGVQPGLFLKDFIEAGRVFHIHMKDTKVHLDGRSGLLGSHLDFGDLRRGWNFRSLGHGDIDFEEIIRILNANNYQGPLSVEWEDSGMDRVPAATKACSYVRELDFEPSKIAFDAAIANKD